MSSVQSYRKIMGIFMEITQKESPTGVTFGETKATRRRLPIYDNSRLRLS